MKVRADATGINRRDPTTCTRRARSSISEAPPPGAESSSLRKMPDHVLHVTSMSVYCNVRISPSARSNDATIAHASSICPHRSYGVHAASCGWRLPAPPSAKHKNRKELAAEAISAVNPAVPRLLATSRYSDREVSASTRMPPACNTVRANSIAPS